MPGLSAVEQNSSKAALAAGMFGGGVATFVDGPGTSPLQIHTAGSRLLAPDTADQQGTSDAAMFTGLANLFDGGASHVPGYTHGRNETVLFAWIPRASIPSGSYAVCVSAVSAAGESPIMVAAMVDSVSSLQAAVHSQLKQTVGRRAVGLYSFESLAPGDSSEDTAFVVDGVVPAPEGSSVPKPVL